MEEGTGILDKMRKHPIWAGCAIMLLLMFALLGACVMGIVTSPFAKAAPPPTIDCPAPAAWTVTAANTLICAGALPPDPGGGTDPPPVTDECPANALRINNGWGNNAIETSQYGTFKDNILAVKVAPPVGWTGTLYSSWVEYQAGPFNRVALVSTIPCSFDKTKALKYSNGEPVFSGNNIRPSFSFKAGAAGQTSAGLTPGQVYYLNIKNANSDGTPNCTVSSCSMRGGL